jgi:hypothetical protein
MQAQLEACAAHSHSTLLDRRRPVWEAHVIDGLRGRQAGMYICFHHAMLDGATGIALATIMLDRTPTPPKAPLASRIRAEGRPPQTAALAGPALRHDIAQHAKLVRRLPDLFSFLAGGEERPGGAAVRRSLAFGPPTPEPAQRLDQRQAQHRRPLIVP